MEKSNILMLLQEERDLDLGRSNRALEFFRLHLFHSRHLYYGLIHSNSGACFFTADRITFSKLKGFVKPLADPAI